MGTLFFFGCIILLIAGYFIYGKIIEKVFGIDPKIPTPVMRQEDGVDYVQMPTWRIYLIQLLNIAGLGPIIGTLAGALYGPIALVWVVLGTIFAGAVHDFASGFLSMRKGGESIPEVVGDAMGQPARYVMRIFSLILLILVGVIFVIAPAGLINALLSNNGIETASWIVPSCIFVYYIIATMIPIDKIIGKLYPLFGLLLLFMTFGVAGALIIKGYEILPNLDFFTNTHPLQIEKSLHIWPMLFVTLSCGAISGFHSTQSPLMAKCIKNEKHTRRVFYGSMIMEGIIGLIWCTVGLSFYDSTQALLEAGSYANIVNEVTPALLGKVGGILAILGVVILPITSGDTSFRGARLIIADSLGLDQKSIIKRLYIAVPMFAIGIVLVILGKSCFGAIWRYFGWANQTLAMIILWTAAIYLAKKGRFHWVASIPATFMTAVSTTFITQVKIGFGLPYNISVIIGIVVAVAAMAAFLILVKKTDTSEEQV